MVIHACLTQRDEADVRELQDLVSDLLCSMEYLCEPAPDVELSLHIGETDASWPGHMHGRLFLAMQRPN